MASRSLTLLIVPATTPDELAALDFTGDGATRIELVHAGEPDALVRLVIGLPESPRVWDATDRAIVVTRVIAAPRLEVVPDLLAPTVELAQRIVAVAGGSEDPARIAQVLVEAVVEPPRGPAEEAATYLRSLLALVPKARELGMGIAWQLRGPVTCSCGLWDGTTHRELVLDQFEILSRDGSSGRIRCKPCWATFAFVEAAAELTVTREPVQPGVIELSPGEIDRAVAGLRDSMEVNIGGSRCHTTYRGRDGAFYIEDFDEGVTDERPLSEADLRSVIAGSPGEFLEVLRKPLRAALRDALLGATQVPPIDCLHELLVYGDCLRRRHLLAAILAWPDVITLSPDAAADLVSVRDGNDVFHFIRQAVGYGTSTRPVGEYGLHVFATIDAMRGGGDELPHWRHYRSEFRGMTGDTQGAIEDLEWELARLPADDAYRESAQRELAKLVDARILGEIAAAPDDDAPRLVWADMLTERGDPRGEFIVAQCTLAHLDEDDPARATLEPRVHQLVAIHGRGWGERRQGFARGFVDVVEIRWITYAAQIDAYLAMSPPVTELRFRAYVDDTMMDPASILEDPRLDRFVTFDFADPLFRTADPANPGSMVDWVFGSDVVARIAGRLRGMRGLVLKNAQLRPEDFTRIGPRPNLRELDLAGSSLRGSADGLVATGRFDELRVLTLERCELADADVPALAKLPRLEELAVSDNPIGADGARLLAGLPIRRLRLAGSTVGDAGAAAFRTAPALRTLNLARSGITNAGVAQLADLALTCLDLEGNAFDEAGVRALVQGRIATSLHRLSLGHAEQRVGAGAARVFEGMPQLWQLLLRRWAVDGDGACALLEALPGIRGLGLGHCAIDDAGLAKLVAHPAFARLEVLELDHNRLGPDAGAILARAARLPLRLYLGGNRLGDAGARALAEGAALARVDELLLQDNGITDEGAAALVAGSSQLVSTIGRLCLHENTLGEDAVKACTDKLAKRLCFELPMAP